MQPVESVIIPVAGMGVRLGLNIPKCLLKIDDITILERQLLLVKNFKRIFLVSGFCSKEVYDLATSINKNVIFINNPNYKNTETIDSINLVTKNISDNFIIMDGDLIIDPTSFEEFLKQIDPKENLVCTTDLKTKKPVYVDVKEGYIHKFSFNNKTNYEWSGVAHLNNVNIMNADSNASKGKYIFERLESLTPLKSFNLNCCEIDCPEDLLVAKKMASTITK